MPINLCSPDTNKSAIEISYGLSIDKPNYDKLIQYLGSRVKYSFDLSYERARSMDKVDRQLLGDVTLTGDQKDARKQTEDGKPAKVFDINLTLGQAQIDTCVTALLDMLVPTDNMYEPFGDASQQAATSALSVELNRSADKFNHITEYHKAISDVLRYDLCGVMVEWDRIIGNKLSNNAVGDVQVDTATVVYQGNKLTAIDPRNLFFDPSVPPEKVSTCGQYVGYAEKVPYYRLNELCDQGKLDIDYVIDKQIGLANLVSLNDKPILRKVEERPEDAHRSNLDILFGTEGSPDKYITMVTMFIKIRPSWFGLGDSAIPEVWCFRIVGDRIAYAAKLDNAHGRLPIVVCTATADSLGSEMLGYAESLIPMQRFASFLINSKQRAYRKQLYGITFYDKNKIDMRQPLTATANNDFENAFIPVDVSEGGSIGQLVQSFNDAPDTSSIISDLGNVKTLMQDLLPTDSRQMLGNLSRVSQWQAQRTVRETDKRTIKVGRLLNASLIAQIKYLSIFNVLQNVDYVKVRQPDGNYADVPIAELRDQDLELKITSALRGIDKDLVAEQFRDLLNTLIQTPAINSEYNILAMLQYWSSLVGMDVDLSQFKTQSPFDKLSPEQKQAAFTLLQQVAAQQQSQDLVPDAAQSLDLTKA